MHTQHQQQNQQQHSQQQQQQPHQQPNQQQSHHKQQHQPTPQQLPPIPDGWICILCRKICHYRGLGDLFGPYNINFSDHPDKCASVTPRKNKFSLLNHSYAVREIWVHEDCLVWSEGVHLVGKKILKMEDVVKASLGHNCTICKSKGASIGCVGKRCRKKFHYVCARDGNCQLDESNFSLKCEKCVANDTGSGGGEVGPPSAAAVATTTTTTVAAT